MTVKFTEARIRKMHKEGLGTGKGSGYKPWLAATDFSSSGRARRAPSAKTGRTHHLFSDVEYKLFLALEWSRDVVDIREQYPLDRDVTQVQAQKLGIRHPFYPNTKVPTVMTVDFLVTRLREGEEVFEAFDAKRTDEAEEPRSLLKLEITRTVCQLMGITHHLVYDTLIPANAVANIDWIRDALPKDGEKEPRPAYWSGLAARMATELIQGGYDASHSLAAYCALFDARHGVEPGSGLRTARMLMAQRVIKVDLAAQELNSQPMASFLMTSRPGRLRAVGDGS